MATRKSRRKRSRRRGRNPGAVTLRSPMKALTAGFNKTALVDAGIVAGGAFGNYYLRNKITSAFGLSGTWSDGLGSYVIELSSAGLLLFVPKVGKKLFTGALIGAAVRGLKQAVPNVAKLGEFLNTGTGVNGFGEALEYGGVSGYLDSEAYETAEEGMGPSNASIDQAAADLFD